MIQKDHTTNEKTSHDAPIRSAFYRSGESFLAAGNTPFLLDGRDNFYFVFSGKIEIFLTKLDNGKPVGPRKHFFGAIPGDGLLGMNLDEVGQGFGLLAVGIHGTQVIRISTAYVRELAQKSGYTQPIIGILNKYIARLSRAISQDMNPRTDVLLVPQDEYLLIDGCKARSKKSVIWTKIKKGNALFIGMEEISSRNQQGLFPLAQDTWLQALGQVVLDTYDTQSIIHDESCWQGFDFFSEVLFKCETLNTKFTAVDEYNRLQQKTHFDRIARETALAETAGILSKVPSGGVSPKTKNLLYEACRAVGQKIGVQIVLPQISKETSAKVDMLSEIARASGFRIRKVVLHDHWWENDGGHLVGYLEANEQPVALLQNSPKSYEIYDPAKSVTIPIDAQTASSLLPFAFMLYRPFAQRTVKAWDLLRFGLRGCHKDIITVVLLGSIAGMLGLLTPIFSGILFDSIIPGAERNQLLQLVLALLMSSVAIAIFHLVRGISILRIEGKMDGALQPALWDRILLLPAAFFRKYSAGDLAYSANGLAAMRQILSGTTITSILGSIFAVFNFGLLFYYDWRLAIVATALALFSFLFLTLVSLIKLRYHRKILKIEGKISGLVFQLISGIAKLRVGGAEGRAFAIWAKEFTKQKRLAFKERNIENGLSVFNSVFPIITSMCLFSTIVMVSNGSAGSRVSELSTGHFLAFYVAFATFLAATLEMSTAVISVIPIIAIHEKIKPILETEPEVDKDKMHPGELRGEIEISHLSFRYHPEAPLVLKDISFTVKPGEFIAVVGPSGSGKSTIIRLLLGFEIPETGALYFDGKDLSGLDLHAVRRQIGVVLQNGRIMSGTIFDNIVGSSLLTLDDAWEAAEIAGLKEDIEEMPMQMHTVISEGGSNLSGGQRQRLLIARAVASKPRVLIFDEATSALDNKTQAIVSERLENLQASRIVIAHRLSTVKNADCIYVVENGVMVESGVYEDLMQQNGPFHALAERQLK